MNIKKKKVLRTFVSQHVLGFGEQICNEHILFLDIYNKMRTIKGSLWSPLTHPVMIRKSAIIGGNTARIRPKRPLICWPWQHPTLRKKKYVSFCLWSYIVTINKKKVLRTFDSQPVLSFGDHIWNQHILFVYICNKMRTIEGSFWSPPTHPAMIRKSVIMGHLLAHPPTHPPP